MSKIYIGIDNGSTGSIGILIPDQPPQMHLTPSKEEQDYTKTKNRISRIDHPKLVKILEGAVTHAIMHRMEIMAVLERPMVNPQRFRASGCALRALESTMLSMEYLAIPYMFTDSKGWQKMLLPSGIVGSDLLKRASKEAGIRLFPALSEAISKHKDADGLMIAEWARRSQL